MSVRSGPERPGITFPEPYPRQRVIQIALASGVCFDLMIDRLLEHIAED